MMWLNQQLAYLLRDIEIVKHLKTSIVQAGQDNYRASRQNFGKTIKIRSPLMCCQTKWQF